MLFLLLFLLLLFLFLPLVVVLLLSWSTLRPPRLPSFDLQQGKIQRLGVKQLEVKIVSGLRSSTALAPIRVVASNPTGYAVRVDTYVEVRDEYKTNGGMERKDGYGRRQDGVGLCLLPLAQVLLPSAVRVCSAACVTYVLLFTRAFTRLEKVQKV